MQYQLPEISFQLFAFHFHPNTHSKPLTMSDNQIWYRYNPDKALTDAEREVMAKGYPYVSTTELAA